MDQLKTRVFTYLKGIAMGGADVVPGVSGGTIAFITGIYPRLLSAIKSADIVALKMLFSGQFKPLWEKVDGRFLLPLVLGIATSLFTLTRLIKYLLENEAIMLWSFFFGLIAISSTLVLREVRKWRLVPVVAVFIGIAIAYGLTVTAPVATSESHWFIFLAGALAICAMILPGISGAFILLTLGKYEFIIDAVHTLNLPVLIVFALGCLAGLLSFSRAVSWLLDHYHDITVALLSGFMIGSLNKVWPWKLPREFRIDSEGRQVVTYADNVLPGEFLDRTGEYPMVLQAVLAMALGIFIVVLIEKLASRKTQPQS